MAVFDFHVIYCVVLCQITAVSTAPESYIQDREPTSQSIQALTSLPVYKMFKVHKMQVSLFFTSDCSFQFCVRFATNYGYLHNNFFIYNYPASLFLSAVLISAILCIVFHSDPAYCYKCSQPNGRQNLVNRGEWFV